VLQLILCLVPRRLAQFNGLDLGEQAFRTVAKDALLDLASQQHEAQR